MYMVEETDNRFCIKVSTLPNAGYGCFAKETIKKGDALEIIGVYVKIGSPADLCTNYATKYKFAACEKGTNHIVPMGYAAIVNHTDDKQQNCEIRWNKAMQRRSPHCGQVSYVMLRDIEAGEELLGNYGPAAAKNILWHNEQKEWKTFLSHDLYNFGLLTDKEDNA